MNAHRQLLEDHAGGASPDRVAEGRALLSADEPGRLNAVRRYDVLDTPPDGAFDRITALAARQFGVPIAIVSIVDTDRIWFKSHHGLDVKQIDRDPGLCASAILQNEPWVVEDAAVDPRALANPLVAGEFGLRFYAGAPLTTHDGFNLGVFCLIDHEPRRLRSEETASLVDMAAIVVSELELRLAARRFAEAQHERERGTAEGHAQKLQDADIGALMSALEATDESTATHSLSVVVLARAVAKEMGLPAAVSAEVGQIALLHDVGKMAISADLLANPDRLNDEGWARIREHPVISERIVASLERLAHLGPALRAAHERWDGGGYPDGLKGEGIPIASRIVFACDSYDAMVTDRPYRRALSLDQARARLRSGAGSQFDPDVIDHLLAIIDGETGGP